MEPFDLIDQLRNKDCHTKSDVESLRRMSEGYPDCPELWDVLGDLQQICVDHEYEIDESVACYRKAIACDPQYAPAHVSLGYAYDTYFDDFANAAEHFRLAIAFGAGDTARIGLARVLAQLGDADAAVAELDGCSDLEHVDVLELRREISKGLWFDPPLDQS
jgi:tetratricopeptide (TPR) repeat protein